MNNYTYISDEFSTFVYFKGERIGLVEFQVDNGEWVAKMAGEDLSELVEDRYDGKRWIVSTHSQEGKA